MDTADIPVHYLTTCPVNRKLTDKLIGLIPIEDCDLGPRELAISIMQTQANRGFKELLKLIGKTPPYPQPNR